MTSIKKESSNNRADLIVTLTTIPPRFSGISLTLNDLLAQTAQIAEIRLNIPRHYRRFPDWDGTLPDVPKGVRVCRIDEDFGPATKVLPTVADLSGQNIEVLLCDDDHRYDENWAQRFIDARFHKSNACIAGHGYDLDNRPTGKNYNVKHAYFPRVRRRVKGFRYRLRRLVSGFSWKPPLVSSEGFADIFEGVAGAMIRPDFLPHEVFDIPDVLWTVDDPWLSGHLSRNGIPIWVITGNEFMTRDDDRHSNNALFSMTYKGYDRQAADEMCIEYFRRHYNVWQGDRA